MKKTFTLIFILVSCQLVAQSWADDGANWKYSYSSGFGTIGYVDIQYIGDTLIESQVAQKLNKKLIAYYFPSNQPINHHLGTEYTYENNGVIMIRNDANWDTLYNFNATIGESWNMAKAYNINPNNPRSKLSVTSTGTKMINGTLLRYSVLTFHFADVNHIEKTDTIIEKIGFLNSYMLPLDFYYSMVDGHEGGPFRCYSDDNFSTYKSYFTNDCNNLSTDPILDPIQLTLFPNPASHYIQLSSNLDLPNLHYEITNLEGKIVLSGKYLASIDLSSLTKGLYLITILGAERSKVFKFTKN